MNFIVDDVVRLKRAADFTVLLLKVLWPVPTFQ